LYNIIFMCLDSTLCAGKKVKISLCLCTPRRRMGAWMLAPPFLTSALDRDQCSASRPSLLVPWKPPVPTA
jgi:hypothetical protein